MSVDWFAETLYPEYRQTLRIDEVLFRGRTAFQEALIFRNERFGRVLTLDGVVQTTEKDEFCYHEMIAHVPIVAHGAVKNVLIIGGGPQASGPCGNDDRAGPDRRRYLPRTHAVPKRRRL